MNLLLITPQVDPERDLLGFCYNWVIEFSKNVDTLYVITSKVTKKREFLEKIPKNVKIVSLNTNNKFLFALKLFYHSFRLISSNKVDFVFTHLYHQFPIVVGPIAKLFGKKIFMWNVHKQVSISFKIANLFVDKIVTSDSSSVRLKTNKKLVISHGVPSNFFVPSNKKGEYILCNGRVHPIKNYETLIEALSMLKEKVKVRIVGPCDNEKYKEKLDKLIVKYNLQDSIEFFGRVKYVNLPKIYDNCKFLINLTPIGNFDKVVLEAMSSNKPVIVANEAFKEYLSEPREKFIFNPNNPKELSERIKWLIENEKDWNKIGKENRKLVIQSHDLGLLAKRVVKNFKQA